MPTICPRLQGGPRYVLIRSWTLKQWLIQYSKLFQGKGGRWALFTAPYTLSPGRESGVVTVSAIGLWFPRTWFTTGLWLSRTQFATGLWVPQILLVSSLMFWRPIPHVGVLKVVALVVLRKETSSTRSWELGLPFRLHGTMPGLGFLVRVLSEFPTCSKLGYFFIA